MSSDRFEELTSVSRVRVEATNQDGVLIGKTLSPAKYRSCREKGIALPDLALGLDLNNNSALGFGFPEWRRNGTMTDIELRPDESTLVEWKPGVASVIGDLWTLQGEPIGADPRQALKRITAAYAERGLSILACVEIEATVFQESIDQARAQQYQNLTPLGGNAGAALVHAKSPDYVEYVEAVVARFDEIGIPWEAYSDEAASGQIEFNIAPADPVTAADRWARARQVMREVAYSLGRSITFMSKWSAAYGQGAHLNVSVSDENGNIFFDANKPGEPSERMRHFIGGVMATLEASTSFALPTITSYRRLMELEGPPTTQTWGVANKSCAVRAVPADNSATRLEYRLPSADSNMYCTLAAFLAGGLLGLDEKTPPPAPFEQMAWALVPGSVPAVPKNLYDAVAALDADDQLRRYLGDEFVDYWVGHRRWEWLSFHTEAERDDAQLSVWEFLRYFELA
ncbi:MULTISPECIES: glutamine synthetase family protein [Nocardia]|uniref:glutamine synthetase family protein n=1 Tax=Nocardia TaxID=1817 RepID=UPI0007EA3B5B|nr:MULTISPECIES: glutamine synthetase family protein [Nocardia]OBA56246.1 glutamine synthetase [Nocardia sp. 852002-51101_SCH5132738]OBB46813.1 glutamine synthetase [Nocardia sp. 852002-51244_SCH5132740]OBF84893.1 glutamine synthetase [Mycobacterium sp. 852002-51759_SCH5129042]